MFEPAPRSITARRSGGLRAVAFLFVAAALAASARPLIAQDGRLTEEESQLEVATLQSVVWTMDQLDAQTSERDLDETVRILMDLGPEAGRCLVALRRKYQEPIHLKATVRVLDALRSEQLDGYLAWMAGAQVGVEVRRNAYEALSRHGTARALPGLVAAMDRDPRALYGASGIALAEILRRHPEPSSYLALRRAMGSVSIHTQIRVLKNVADVGSVEGFKLHAELLGKDPEVDGGIVSGLARMQHADDTAAILPRLRVLVSEGDPFTRRQAVIALGKYEDPGSFDVLIELLASPDHGIRENALWSLRNVSGLRLPADAGRWRLWHEQEMKWWEEEGRDFLLALGFADQPAVLLAIRRLSEHPLFRNVVHAELKRLAKEGKLKVQQAAKKALGQLGFELEDEPKRGVLAAASMSIDTQPPLAAGEEESGKTAEGIEIGRSKFPLALLFVGAAVLVYLLLRVLGIVLPRPGGSHEPITMKTRSLAERYADIRKESEKKAKEATRKG